MEDLVLCYDTLSPDAINFARKVYESLLLCPPGEAQVREPVPTDKTSFTPAAANLAVLVTPGIGENNLVRATVEKAVQTKKCVIFVEDLLRGASGQKEIVEGCGFEEAILKKMGKPAVIPYVLECASECNDELLQNMKFSDPSTMQAGVESRRTQVLDDILRFSAKVSKLRLQAQVKRRVDFCLTCANPAKFGDNGEKAVLALKSVFDKRSPALTVECNRGDKSTAASAIRIQHVQECFNLVVVVTKGALEDPDLIEEIRAALESEVQITIVQYLEEVQDLEAVVKAEASFGGDDVLRSNLSRIIPFPYLSHLNEAVVRALVVPETVKCDELKTPRTRAAGIPTFRLGYKNLLSLDMPTDGRCPIYRHQKEFPNMKIPDDIESSIKNLWALYAKDDPDLKKEEQKPVEDRKISWDAFVAVDRCVVETVGADYSEMVSRRIYSMMLYPGLTLDEKVSYQTFYNYYAYVAKKMGACSGDPDVQKHFKYVEDKVKFVQKSKRYQFKYDLFITHDRSKVSNKLALDIVNAIRTFTPNVRMEICTNKRIEPEVAAGGSLNVAVIMTPGCLGNEKVVAEVAAAKAGGAKMLVISDVKQSPNFIAELTQSSEAVKQAFARPAVVDFSTECQMAAAMNMVDNLSFPDPDKSRPEAMKTSCYHRRENPVASFMYKACLEENEMTTAQQTLANCTGPTTLNAATVRENFLRDGGCEVLVDKFANLCSVASVAETGLRAIANVGMDQGCAQRLAELNIVKTIVEVMNNHADNAMIQGEACRALATLAANEEARLRINQAKGFQKVLQTQKKFELEQDEDFRNCRFSYIRLEEGDQIMMNFPARKVWVSAVVTARNSNGTYDIECAHGSREEKVSAQWIRPRAPGDNIQEFSGVWAWKPQGKLTEDELVLKPDGMSQLRGTGSVGTWNPKDTKGKGRSMIKLQLGSTILDMERISVTMLISTTTSHRAVLLDKYDDCLLSQYWWFNYPEWIENGIPNLLGRKADVKRLEQIIYNEPQKESKPWVGLPDKMDENFVAQWSGLLKIEQGGEYTFFISSEHHARLVIDDTQIISAEGVNSLTESTASVALFPGERSIVLTFVYKSGGSKACTLRYKGADTDGEKRVIPAAVLQNWGVKGETVPKPGIIAQYYRNDDFTGSPDIIRVEKQLDFASTSDPWENLPARYGSSSWSARFACYLRLKCGGAKKAKYTFRLASGKKGKLYMGGSLLSDDDEPKEVELEPGEHFVEVEYKTSGGSNELQLFYAGPETSPGEDAEKNPLPGVEQTVPSTRTRHYVLPTCALPKGNPISVTEGEAKASVVSVEWAFDDSFVVSADENGSIRLWSIIDGSPVGEKGTVDGSLTCGAIGRKSTNFAVGMMDGGIQLFNLGGNAIAARGEKMGGHEGAVHALNFNHDDKLLVSVGMDGTTRIWDVATQQEVTNAEDPLVAYKHVEEKKAGGKDPICGFKSKIENSPAVTQGLQEVMTMQACSFSVDSKVIAVGGDDKRVRLLMTDSRDFVRGPDIMVEIPVVPELDEEGNPIEVEPELDEEGNPLPPPPPEYEAVPGHPYYITGHNDSVNGVSFAPTEYGGGITSSPRAARTRRSGSGS
jgi:hypothetical protein